jgi:hypothetical protein
LFIIETCVGLAIAVLAIKENNNNDVAFAVADNDEKSTNNYTGCLISSRTTTAKFPNILEVAEEGKYYDE